MKRTNVYSLTTSMFLAVVSATFICIFAMPLVAGAADARNYDAGRIIDDVVFTNKSSMSVQEIQNFLNSKTTCDTWGRKTSELGGGTRAQWMNARGVYAPFRCVTDYKENPSTGQNNYGKTDAPAGAISAAQIIYNYSQQYNINPQVIIATLQKENGMITDEWPTPKQFSEAMGFGCPDNVAPGAPACNPVYGSFSAQVYQAARHFRGYMDNQAGWWVPFTTGWNSIAWSPNTACGRGDVYIQNRATVALYSYTPYQPNAAARNAQYGTGDSCSSYGNRNFYMYFTDWFGATYADVAITSPLRVNGPVAERLFTNAPTVVSFSIHNYRPHPINIGGMAVTVRDSVGRNYDFALREMVIPAYATTNYVDAQYLPIEETYTFGIANYSGGVWRSDYPATRFVGHSRSYSSFAYNAPTLTVGVSADGALYKGGRTKVGFTVKNNSTRTLDMGQIGLAVRGPSGQNLDPGVANVSLAAGQSQEIAYQFTPPHEGLYRFSVAATTNSGVTWEQNYPIPSSGATKDQLESIARPSVLLTSEPSLSQSGSHVGGVGQVKFTVKNFSDAVQSIGKLGLWGRDPQNKNVDPGVVDVTLAPNEERVMSFPVGFAKKGQYKFGVLSTYDNGRTWTSGPERFTDDLDLEVTADVTDPVKITAGVSVSAGVQYALGSSATLTYTIKNHSNATISLGKLGLWGRDPQNKNVDPGVVDVTLAPNEERVMSFPVGFAKKGQYKFGILSTRNSGATWENGPDRASADVLIEKVVSVKDSVTLTSGLQATPSQLLFGSSATLTYTIKNHSNATISLGKLGLWGRDPQNKNVDPGVVDVTLAPNEERVMSFPVGFAKKGQYKFGVLSTYDNGRTWTSGPERFTDDLDLEVTADVTDPVKITAGVSVSAGVQYALGSSATLTYTIKNHSNAIISLGKLGLWGRDPQNKNVDPGVVDVTLAPNEERVMSFPVGFAKKGQYKFGILSTRNSGATWENGPDRASADVLIEKVVSVKDSVTLTSGLQATPSQLLFGSSATLTYTIKNHSNATISLGKLGLWGRDPQNKNVDPGVVDVTLAPNEERVMSFPVGFAKKGQYKFGVLSTRNNGATWESGPDKDSTGLAVEAVVGVE